MLITFPRGEGDLINQDVYGNCYNEYDYCRVSFSYRGTRGRRQGQRCQSLIFLSLPPEVPTLSNCLPSRQLACLGIVPYLPRLRSLCSVPGLHEISVHAERQGVKQESDLWEAWDLSGYPGSVSRGYRKVGEMEKVRGRDGDMG